MVVEESSQYRANLSKEIISKPRPSSLGDYEHCRTVGHALVVSPACIVCICRAGAARVKLGSSIELRFASLWFPRHFDPDGTTFAVDLRLFIRWALCFGT